MNDHADAKPYVPLSKPLVGHRALVTGGGKRVGRALALALAEWGSDVVVHYNSSRPSADAVCREIVAAGRNGVACQADLSIPAEVERLAREAEAAFGPLNYLINSASYYADGDQLVSKHSLLEETLEEWDYSLAVNARAPFFLTQLLAPKMAKQANASVVNIVDRSIGKPFLSRAAHTVSKSALVAVTKLAAASLAPEVRVNALELGAILPGDEMSESERSKVRWGGVDSVSAALYFVLTNSFVNGEVIGVKGNAFSYDG